ncbi:MAG: precorrin-6y C5,15-methyltransferase (decarboxylating) subunit CbiE [Deltaproteobacteria bacterium]|nr:precorrin-6y C5,15-methyltransferase (decarboxylating) subunit CbiE [Deltaproteobacteria bacterium]
MTESPTPDQPKVIVIGMGLSPDDLTARHLDIIRGADILIAGKRHLDCFKDHSGIQKEITRDIPKLTEFIRRQFKTHRIVVLASGDPLLFGIGPVIIDALGPDHVEIHPNISSVAAAFSRIKEPWQDARVISMHGKKSGDSLLAAVSETDLVAVLTDPIRNPAWIAALLLSHRLNPVRICVLEQLGTPSEKISWHTLEQATQETFSEPNIVVLKRASGSHTLSGLHLGMPDDAYDHENGLITKPEIRAVSLAKLKLQAHHILWDLGAGSGSIGIEASLLLTRGKIVSIEKDPERIRNIESNRLRHGVKNMEIRLATLPDGLDDLLAPDRIFIGGGGRKLETIIRSAAGYLKPDGIIVLNTVLMDNLTIALTTLKELGFSTETIQIQVNRGKDMPWSQRFEAQNPVWIITGIIKS